MFVGYSGSGGERENVKRTAPQWQFPRWVLRSEVGAGGKDIVASMTVVVLVAVVEGRVVMKLVLFLKKGSKIR